jgi:hypothetical protein
VKGLAVATVSAQGVRQLGPIELFASAPAGSDSTWTVEAGGGAEGNFKSQLGIQLEMPHPARPSPKATPATPLTRPMTTSAASAANPKFAPQLPRVRLRTSGSKRH